VILQQFLLKRNYRRHLVFNPTERPQGCRSSKATEEISMKINARIALSGAALAVLMLPAMAQIN
jgi:hypothetical protein